MGEPSVADRARADAFDSLMTQTQGALFHFARGIVVEPELARDVVQDAFVDAWRAAAAQAPPFARLDDEIGMRRWLFTVTYRHALKARARRRRVVWESLDAAHAAPRTLLDGSARFEDRIAEAEALRAALDTLDPQDAACFLLQAVHGFSTAEIAAIVGLLPDAARKRLSRAKQRLRAAYESHQSHDAQREGSW